MTEPILAAFFFRGLPIVADMLMAWAQKKTIDHTADSRGVTVQIRL